MQTASNAYRAAIGVALAAVLFLIWATLALGVLAEEGNPADLMYGGVIAVGAAGAFVARLQAPGMARALVATAFAQALVAVIALFAGVHRSPVTSVAEIMGVNGMFVVLFLASAWLFRKAAHRGKQ